MNESRIRFAASVALILGLMVVPLRVDVVRGSDGGARPVVRISDACGQFDPCVYNPFMFCADNEAFVVREDYSCEYPEFGSGCQ